MVTTNALYSNLFLQMDFLFQFTSMHLSLFASFQGKTNTYLSIQEYKVKGIPNGILKILQEKVKTNFGAFGYYFPQIYDCYLL